MHPRLEERHPEDDAQEEIRQRVTDADLVQQCHDEEHAQAHQQGVQEEILRVEDRDDQGGPDVVRDGHRGEQDADADGDSVPHEGEHTEREGDVRSHRNAPAPDSIGSVVEGGEDRRGNDHPAEGRNHGQCGLSGR